MCFLNFSVLSFCWLKQPEMYVLNYNLDYIKHKLSDFEGHQDIKIHVDKSIPWNLILGWAFIIPWNHCMTIFSLQKSATPVQQSNSSVMLNFHISQLFPLYGCWVQLFWYCRSLFSAKVFSLWQQNTFADRKNNK